MTNYSEMFQLAHGDWDMRRVVAALCAGMDKREMELDRIRVRLNFPEDWSPGYDRGVQMGAHAIKSWADRANAINGPGDMWSLVGELCGAMDIIEDRIKDLEPEKKKPGRPTNAEREARNRG